MSGLRPVLMEENVFLKIKASRNSLRIFLKAQIWSGGNFKFGFALYTL